MIKSYVFYATHQMQYFFLFYCIRHTSVENVKFFFWRLNANTFGKRCTRYPDGMIFGIRTDLNCGIPDIKKGEFLAEYLAEQAVGF